MCKSLFWTVCLLGLLCAPAAARLNPDLRWQSAETAHFRILFPAGYDDWGTRAARIAETVHQRLCRDLQHEPQEKTTIILADVADLPNGMATPFPTNHIILYLTAPLEEPFELTDREDWLARALIHEYAHILHLDNVEQGPALLQRVLGRIYFPNMFQPGWLIEGLATWEETRQTGGGRGRSSYTDMVLRMAVLERAFPTLAQAGVFPQRWPGGATPYLFGVAFYQHLLARYGEDLPGALSEAYAGRAFPWLVDSTARRVFGTTYAAEWSAWQMALAERYEQDRSRLTRAGLTPLTLLTGDGGDKLAPSPSPDGRYLVWYQESPDQTPGLRLRDLQSGEERTLGRSLALPSEAGVSWSADDNRLLLARIEQDRRDNLYGDLFRADPATAETVRLTSGLRAARPDAHPRTGEIVCVTREAGRTRLALLDARARLQTVLADGRDGRLYFTPRWAPDGAQLVVGVREADGRFGLLLLDRTGREVQRLPPWRGVIASPAWTPDGRYLLFTSDRDGIFNLYAWQPATGALFRITNVLGGVFAPAPSADGRQLYLTSYSARGFDLAVMPLDPAGWTALDARASESVPPLFVATDREPLAVTPYSPSWPELRPRYWLPWLATDDEGVELGLTTSGSDPLGRHSYAATVLYGLESQRPAWALHYQYDGLLPTIQASVADSPREYADFYRTSATTGEDYWERQRRLALDVDFPSAGLWARWHLVPGVRLTRFDHLDPAPAGFALPPEGLLTGVRLAWRYGNAVKPGRAISLEDGRSLELAIEEYNAAFGGDYRLARQSLDWHEYWTLPGLRHQVLAPRIFLGRSDGEALPQRAWQAGGDVPGDLPTTGLDMTELPLRGYRPNAYRGQYAVLGSLEYRFPLLEVDDGFGNGVLYLRRIHGALFAEGADLFDRGGPRLSRFHTAAGGELRVDVDAGYLLPLTLRLVAARGFDDAGESQIYTALWLRF